MQTLVAVLAGIASVLGYQWLRRRRQQRISQTPQARSLVSIGQLKGELFHAHAIRDFARQEDKPVYTVPINEGWQRYQSACQHSVDGDWTLALEDAQAGLSLMESMRDYAWSRIGSDASPAGESAPEGEAK